jgi:hypothetical protein
MTSLVFYLRPEIVFIAMDTLVTTVDRNEPHHFCFKMFPLPHIGSVMCGTGNMELAVEWFKQIHHNFSSDVRLQDICDLNKETPDRLRELSQCFSQSSICTKTTPSTPLEGKIFYFGYSLQEKKNKGFVYHSQNNFNSKEIEPQFNYQPSLDKPPEEIKPQSNDLGVIQKIWSEQEFINKAIKVMKFQQAEEQKKLPEHQIRIGGKIQVLTMKPDLMQIKTFPL